MRKKPTPALAFEQYLMTALPGLSPEHLAPLREVWHRATWHPHISGRFTPEEKEWRLAARIRGDLDAQVPYACALHAAGLDDARRINGAVEQAHHSAARAIPFPWYVRMRLPGPVCRLLGRRRVREQLGQLRNMILETCSAGWSHPRGTGCPGCDGPTDVMTP